MVKEYILEEAVRQNWGTKFKLYENGHSVIENIGKTSKQSTRTYLNVATTNKFVDRYLNVKKYKVVPANRITNILIKIGIIKINIEEDVNE